MARIHPTALIDAKAELGNDVEVGAYAVIGPHVRIGEGTAHRRALRGRGPHHHRPRQPHLPVRIDRRRAAGQEVRRRADPAGDRRPQHDPRVLHLNTGTVQDAGVTRVGDDNWIMAYVHIAHDCSWAATPSRQRATLAGHVHVGDWAFIGGLSGVHQFVHVGAHAMTGFQTPCRRTCHRTSRSTATRCAVQGINRRPEAARLRRRAHRHLSSRCTAAVPQRPAPGRGGAADRGAAHRAAAVGDADVAPDAGLPGRGSTRGIVR
jgi:UDP-N-acetylglucosamine acyltransferase